LSLDGSRWISCRPRFFLPVRVLSKVFRGKFLAMTRRAFANGQLTFQGTLAHLNDPDAFAAHLKTTYHTDWIVYAKRPFGGPEQVLKYLARYTHRVAISNHRLLSMANGQVRFRWKDYAHKNKKRVMTLAASEFIRRFLLHTLPTGFVRIRHYGFLANPCRADMLARCRELLGTPIPARESEDAAADPACSGDQQAMPRCPACKNGHLTRTDIAPAPRYAEYALRPFAHAIDTS